MSARPSEAGAKAAKWLASEVAASRAPTPTETALRWKISRRQAMRLCAAAGIAPRPVGWPRKAVRESTDTHKP